MTFLCAYKFDNKFWHFAKLSAQTNRRKSKKKVTVFFPLRLVKKIGFCFLPSLFWFIGKCRKKKKTEEKT